MRFALFCHSFAQILSVRLDGEGRRTDIFRSFFPKHSLGYVLRVIVLLEGESSVQSKVPSADHYKDISALCLAALSFSPTWPVFHTCIMFHFWSGIAQVMRSAWFPLDWDSSDLLRMQFPTVWEPVRFDLCKFQVCFHVSSTVERLESGHKAEWSVVVTFVLLQVIRMHDLWSSTQY